MSFGDNEMMMDLFRSEVESHSEVLSDSLLKLERDASDTSVYDSMMRSAHSIKGAARIVQVEAAVHVSHVMEDCFVAAQRGELQIKPSDFDLLLRSVDLLVRIAEATRDAEPQLDQLSGEVHDCVEQLKSLREGRPHSATAAASVQASVAQASVPQPTVPQAAGVSQPTATQLSISPVSAHGGLTPSRSPSQATAPPQSPAEKSEPVRTSTILVLECGTSLLKDNAEILRQTLLRDLKSDVAEVRFDLSQTADIDPVGLAFLASARRHVESYSKAGVSFSPVSDDMRIVLRVTGIAQS
jgi:chemotaxis protein histidine kinase CheA